MIDFVPKDPVALAIRRLYRPDLLPGEVYLQFEAALKDSPEFSKEVSVELHLQRQAHIRTFPGFIELTQSWIKQAEVEIALADKKLEPKVKALGEMAKKNLEDITIAASLMQDIVKGESRVVELHKAHLNRLLPGLDNLGRGSFGLSAEYLRLKAGLIDKFLMNVEKQNSPETVKAMLAEMGKALPLTDPLHHSIDIKQWQKKFTKTAEEIKHVADTYDVLQKEFNTILGPILRPERQR